MPMGHRLPPEPPGIVRLFSSENLKWEGVKAAEQRAAPFAGTIPSSDSHKIIFHKSPADFACRIEGKWVTHTGAQLLHIIPAGASVDLDLRSEVLTQSISLSDSIIQEVFEADLAGGRRALVPRLADGDPSVVRILEAIATALREAADDTALFAAYAARLLALRLLGNDSAGTALDVPAIATTTFSSVTRATDYIRENMGRKITLADLCRETGVSPSVLMRQFRVTTGLPPHRWLVKVRVQRACELLRTTRTPIEEIAFACGFSSQEHLTLSFRKATGVTPGRYRRSAS